MGNFQAPLHTREINKHHSISVQRFNVYRVIHLGGLTESFEVKTGQGCMLSPFLFLLVINWITKQSMDSRRTGIRWISGKSLEDLEFADDVSLFSVTCSRRPNVWRPLQAQWDKNQPRQKPIYESEDRLLANS